MPDWKNIGLTGKDILMGVVTVVAGAEGGQAGAQGAQQIDRGLDRVLDMAGVQQQKAPPSRMNPEEADFAVRKHAMVAVKTTPPSSPAPPESVVVAKEQTPQALPPQVKEELAKRGYSEAEIQAIATGQFRGIPKRSAEGTRIATEEGTPKKSAAADGGGAFEGFSLGDVLGVVKSLGKG